MGSESVKQVLNSYTTQKRPISDIKQHMQMMQSVSAMVTYIMDKK